MSDSSVFSKIPIKIKQSVGKLFITTILVATTINTMNDLTSLYGKTNIIGFGFVTLIALYARISKKIKYLLSYSGLIFFFIAMSCRNNNFDSINVIAFYLPVVYGYLLQDIFSPILSGITAEIILLGFIDKGIRLEELIGNAIGLCFATIGFTTIFYMIRMISYQRDKYKELSITDTLTGVVNLNHLLEVGDKIIEDGNSLTAYVFDVDHFKQINYTFGHFAGNEVLVQIADILKTTVKEDDGIVGRLGGDEFVVLIPHINLIKAQNIYNLLNLDFQNRYFQVDKDLKAIRLTISIGMAYTKKESIRIQELLHLADTNMYYNKQHSQGYGINKNLEEVLNDKFRKLLNLIYEKDIYTFVHSQYVVQYASLLASYLKLPHKAINDIILASWLHDVGKMMISNEILRKRGKLTEEEYTEIKSHVNWGVTLLANYSLSDRVIEGILYHHERFDGKGYPQGLDGDDTPLNARIIQIADSFSAMTIKRVYRGHHNQLFR